MFIDTYSERAEVVLQIQNANPILKDNEFAKQVLKSELANRGLPKAGVAALASWLVSLSLRKHGTTVFILDPAVTFSHHVLKAVDLTPNRWSFSSTSPNSRSISVLDSLSAADGALVLDLRLRPRYAGVILPMSPSKGKTHGGARHNSTKSFSQKFKCLGIVVSDDGPITVFDKGEKKVCL